MTKKARVTQLIPALSWIRHYSPSQLKGDLNAGLTVGIMLIPQGMAYAVLAGLPPIYGLYSSMVPLILYALFGTSRQLAVGPVAMVSLLVVAGAGELAEAGSARFIQLAIMTALGVGVLQLMMGLFRMGFLVNFLSHPVLSGFTSAAALIIGASQLKNLLGIDLPRTNYVHEIIVGVLRRASEIEPITAAIGIGSIALIIAIRTWKPTFPSALVVVVAGALLTGALGLDERGVAIVGEIPTGLPSFQLVAFSLDDVQQLLPMILVIALVGYMESIAVAKAIANKHGYKVDPNQELVALGVANIGGAFFQAYPTTGGFSRTAVNDQAGARTGMASLISAGIIGLTVVFLTPYFYYLPMSVLASVIIVAVAGLFDTHEMRELWKKDRRDLAMLATTFIATLSLGIEQGILVGVVLSLVVVIYSSAKPHSTELGRLGDSKTYRNITRYTDARVREDVLIYRFDSQLYFANVEFFRDDLEEHIAEKGQGLELVVLDASAMSSIDSTGVHSLKELIKDLAKRGIRFSIAGAIGPVRDKLKICGVVEEMGEDNFWFDVDEALQHFENHDYGEETPAAYSPLQSNV
ncbi:MAG: SulP family inorganic anion transporter [Spirochaetota bacterium]